MIVFRDEIGSLEASPILCAGVEVHRRRVENGTHRLKVKFALRGYLLDCPLVMLHFVYRSSPIILERVRHRRSAEHKSNDISPSVCENTLHAAGRIWQCLSRNAVPRVTVFVLLLGFEDLQNQLWHARRAIKLVDETTQVLAIAGTGRCSPFWRVFEQDGAQCRSRTRSEFPGDFRCRRGPNLLGASDHLWWSCGGVEKVDDRGRGVVALWRRARCRWSSLLPSRAVWAPRGDSIVPFV